MSYTQNLDNIGVSPARQFHFGTWQRLEGRRNSRPNGGSDCQRADIIHWIMLYEIDYLVGRKQSTRKSSQT